MNLYVSELHGARATFPLSGFGRHFVRGSYRRIRRAGMSRTATRHNVVLILMATPGWTAR